MPKIIDLTGDRYGRLTVVRYFGIVATGKAYVCRCDCGTELVLRSAYLRTGDTRSCGCLKRDDTVNRFTTHAMAGTRTHNSWRAMLERCRLPSHPQYHNYGGRGITVCERWREFANFLADMGERPDDLTLDRINVNGNYEPGNCRWADRATQGRNRRKANALRCAEEN
jgi:hypothetical protein